MKLISWFKTKKQLARELEYYQVKAFQFFNLAKIAKDINQLRTWLDYQEDIMVMEGSDISQGKINLSHWAVKLLALNFYDLLKEWNAENYVELALGPVGYVDKDRERITPSLVITIQKRSGETPGQQVQKLKEKVRELEHEITRLMQEPIRKD